MAAVAAAMLRGSPGHYTDEPRTLARVSTTPRPGCRCSADGFSFRWLRNSCYSRYRLKLPRGSSAPDSSARIRLPERRAESPWRLSSNAGRLEEAPAEAGASFGKNWKHMFCVEIGGVRTDYVRGLGHFVRGLGHFVRGLGHFVRGTLLYTRIIIQTDYPHARPLRGRSTIAQKMCFVQNRGINYFIKYVNGQP